MRIHARTVLEREAAPPERAPSVLYHFGVATANLGMPADAVPPVCREGQCSLRITDPRGHCGSEMEHEGGDGVAVYHISAEQLNAMYYDLWADIRRWIAGLHEGEGTA